MSFLLSYPDATAEDLEAGDSTCIICREEMQAQPAANDRRQNIAGTCNALAQYSDSVNGRTFQKGRGIPVGVKSLGFLG